MAQPTQSTQSKIWSAVIAIAAAWAAQRLVSAAWEAASGHKPPDADDDTGAGLGEVAAAAAVSGAVMAVVRVLAARGALRAID